MSETEPDDPTRVTARDVKRVAIVLLIVLAFQVVFALSYIGAFHDPKPHDLPVGVVAPNEAIARAASAAIPNDGGFDVRLLTAEATAREQMLDQELYAALVVGATGDKLLVASASSVDIAEGLQLRLAAVEKQANRTLTVEDVAPVDADDSRGLVPFYLLLSWVVGAYLGASVISIVRGTHLSGRRGALLRIGTLAVYALVSGFVLTGLTAAVFGVVNDSYLTVALVGALVVFSVGLSAAALQALLGLAGSSVVLLVFVAFGSPASGGPAARPLLPSPWRTMGEWIPNGAGTDALRRAIYFSSNQLGPPVLTLLVWALVGAVVMLLVARPRRPGEHLETALLAGVAAA